MCLQLEEVRNEIVKSMQSFRCRTPRSRWEKLQKVCLSRLDRSALSMSGVHRNYSSGKGAVTLQEIILQLFTWKIHQIHHEVYLRYKSCTGVNNSRFRLTQCAQLTGACTSFQLHLHFSLSSLDLGELCKCISEDDKRQAGRYPVQSMLNNEISERKKNHSWLHFTFIQCAPNWMKQATVLTFLWLFREMKNVGFLPAQHCSVF